MNVDYPRQTMKLFYELGKTGCLYREEHPELFNLMSDEFAYPYIKMFQEEWKCVIKNMDNQALYLIPNPENDVFGVTDQTLKKILPNWAQTKKDIYLTNYIFMVILNLFYVPGQETTIRPYRDFVSLSKLEEEVTHRLKDACHRMGLSSFQAMSSLEDGSLDQEFKNILDVQTYWSAKLISKEKGQYSRLQLLKNVISFMENQGLIDYDTKMERLYPTSRLSAIMQNFCYSERERVLNLLAVDAQTFEEETKQSEMEDFLNVTKGM